MLKFHLLPDCNVDRIAVRTGDFRLAFRVMRELRRRGISFVLLDLDNPLESANQVWITSSEDANSQGRAVIGESDKVELAVERAIHASRGISHTKELVFGVDPGPRPGMVWLADGELIGTAQLEKIDDVATHVRGIASALDYGTLIVRIGDGSPTERNRIVNCCLARNLFVELVDEHRTSSGLARNLHTHAALRIAMMSGNRCEKRLAVEPSGGELREIQRRSRRQSGGRLTISKELAKAVAVGRLTMEEAIIRHENS